MWTMHYLTESEQPVRRKQQVDTNEVWRALQLLRARERGNWEKTAGVVSVSWRGQREKVLKV